MTVNDNFTDPFDFDQDPFTTDDDKFTELALPDGRLVRVRRLNQWHIKIMNDPAMYWELAMGQTEALTTAQENRRHVGSIAHHLLLKPDEPLPYATEAEMPADTLTTEDQIRAALADILFPDGVSPPARRHTRKPELLEWVKEHAPEIYNSTKEGRTEAAAERAKGKTTVTDAVMEKGTAAAKGAWNKLYKVLAATGCYDAGADFYTGCNETALFEHKLVRDASFTIDGFRVSVPFSMVADIAILPKDDFGGADRTAHIIDLKTTQLRAGDTRKYRERVQAAMWRQIDPALQMRIYQLLLGLDDRPVRFHLLIIPVKDPKNTAHVELHPEYVRSRGDEKLQDGLAKWWECVKRFGGVDAARPWFEVKTDFATNEVGELFEAGQVESADDRMPF